MVGQPPISKSLTQRQQATLNSFNQQPQPLASRSAPRCTMADEGGTIVRYVYRGDEGEVIPRHVTHVTMHELTTVVRDYAFFNHPNITEVISHDKVEKIEELAFYGCPSLRRVIMPGITIIENDVFYQCVALTDVECGKLEIIGVDAFHYCRSLRSINLPSAMILEENAFTCCYLLTDVKFGGKLSRLETCAFHQCTSLERIAIPLKDGIITTDDVFTGCKNLKHVDLVEGAELHGTIAALHMEGWRNDMNEEIDSINQILLDAEAGTYVIDNEYDDDDDNDDDEGEMARLIRGWIRSALRKIIRYQAEHQRLLTEEVATALQLALPRDIVMNNVLPFLELQSHTYEVEEYPEDEDDDSDDEEMDVSV